MNNKFIRILIIINGILIPTLILFLLGSYLTEKYWNDDVRHSDFEQNGNNKVEFEIKNSTPTKIPNTNNYFVAITKRVITEYKYIEEATLDLLPENTINVIFLDKELQVIGKLLEKDGSIKSMFIPNQYSEDSKLIEGINNLSYYIANEDTNNDGKINKNDQHYVYVSDLNGENLIKVTDKKVKQYQWINNNKDLLLTFYSESDLENLNYGIYNLESKTFKETQSLNSTE